MSSQAAAPDTFADGCGYVFDPVAEHEETLRQQQLMQGRGNAGDGSVAHGNGTVEPRSGIYLAAYKEPAAMKQEARSPAAMKQEVGQQSSPPAARSPSTLKLEVGQPPPGGGQQPPEVGQQPPANGQKRNADVIRESDVIREERRKKISKLTEEAAGSPSASSMALKCGHTCQNLSDMPPAAGLVHKALLEKRSSHPDVKGRLAVTCEAQRYK
ncbi:unnamed protein product, partial [Prorocentrum cordatum]